MSLYPVILCGGAGTRLWPASHPARPKQFVAFVGERSLFQETALRVAGAPGVEKLLVVAGQAHAAMIAAQLEAIELGAAVLLEPEARDSAPAIAAACAWIAGRDPKGVAIIVASDHHIPDADAFRDAALTAARAAQAGRITTMGVKPRAPSTAYGYIAPGQPVAGEVRDVLRFVEKPSAETAQDYVAAGYLWNSGNFVAAAETLLNELDEFAPEISGSARQAVEQGRHCGGALLLGDAFCSAPKISIDYAVMEKTKRAAVLPVDFEWSDLGAWDAVREVSGKDERGNAAYGDPILVDAENTLVRAAGGAVVAVVGVRNVAVVAEGRHVLVCDLARSQAVKTAVERMRAEPPAPFTDIANTAHWFDQWLSSGALPLWWSLGADHSHGGFHEALTQSCAAPAMARRARVQARQAFVYAHAGLMGWPGPWRDAARHGLRYMQNAYRRPDGLYRTLVAADGAPLDDAARNYDQAFVLLAMAALHRADPGAAGLTDEASTLLDALQTRRHAAGGFREDGAHPFQSNAHMHLFEAALAWIEADGGRQWLDLADEIAGLALTRFIDAEGGFLREFFDDAWRPASGADGRRVEPGHQFEWAWLLHRWGGMGHPEAGRAARRLFAAGLRGVDAARGVAVDALSEDFSVLEATARLWPQSEFLKAALALGDEGQILTAARALAGYLDTPVRGLWRDRLSGGGLFADEPAPASSFYHLVVAIDELRKRAGG